VHLSTGTKSTQAKLIRAADALAKNALASSLSEKIRKAITEGRKLFPRWGLGGGLSMNKRAGLLVLSVFLAGCATMATQPPVGSVEAGLAFPLPGTKWMLKEVDHTGATKTITWTVLEEGFYEGKPVYRESDGMNTYIYDKATRNHITTLRQGKERYVYSPHNGTFSWPLRVGKLWVASFRFDHRELGRIWDPIEATWKVEAYEDVTVPAGTFQAFRLRSTPGKNNEGYLTIWYAPQIKLIVKRVFERTSWSIRGYGKSVTELIEYSAR